MIALPRYRATPQWSARPLVPRSALGDVPRGPRSALGDVGPLSATSFRNSALGDVPRGPRSTLGDVPLVPRSTLGDVPLVPRSEVGSRRAAACWNDGSDVGPHLPIDPYRGKPKATSVLTFRHNCR